MISDPRYPAQGMSRSNTTPAGAVRARLGFVIPSVNTILEEWLPHVLPNDVSMHVSRVPISSSASVAAVEEMAQHENAAIRLVADCGPDVIIHACVASSALRGPVRDQAFALEIAQETGTRFCTAMTAILTALTSVGARRVCVASPYTEAIDAMERSFFEASGIEVTGTSSLAIGNTRDIARQSTRDILDLGRRAWVPGSDALLISCLALRSHTVVEALEQELGIPVVTATQAALWTALRLSGCMDTLHGYGRLLA